MNPRYLAAAVACFLAAKGCVELYRHLGSHLDADGFLHEPFGLIPLGWAFLFAGAGLLGLAFLRRKK